MHPLVERSAFSLLPRAIDPARQLGDIEPHGGLLFLAAHGRGRRRVHLEREALVYASGKQLAVRRQR